MKFSFHPLCLAACAALALGSTSAAWADTGKLLLTSGVSSIDGAAGGGLVALNVPGGGKFLHRLAEISDPPAVAAGDLISA